MDDAETFEYSFAFTVKESAAGDPWIALEPREATPSLGTSILGIEPRYEDGLTGLQKFEEAKKLAQFLNEKVRRVTHTQFKH